MADVNLADIQDLIVIKRRAASEMEMPKGGVWKIAFADFMTAMMCFFLVMWLINAANEDTRQAVASYFNPIKLSEINPKGLRDPAVVPGGVRKGDKPGAPGSEAATGGDAAADRAALFRDPYAVLSDIAGSAGDLSMPAGSAADAGTPAPQAALAVAGPSGPETRAAAIPVSTTTDELRDPFDPQFRATPPPAGEAIPAAAMDLPPADEPAVPAEPQAADAAGPAIPTATAGAASLDMADPTSGNAAVAPPAPPTPREIQRAALASELADITGEPDAGGEARRDGERPAGAPAAPAAAPDLKVESTGEGTLISLTDNADFGMFAVGSAKPQSELIRIMARIAAVLKDRPGGVVIRGHTDARPFRTPGYDNWRLSTDRAQMAVYMLVRGGLDESRIEAVEGYAERRLKNPADPEGAENRRIEILLKEQPT